MTEEMTEGVHLRHHRLQPNNRYHHVRFPDRMHTLFRAHVPQRFISSRPPSRNLAPHMGWGSWEILRALSHLSPDSTRTGPLPTIVIIPTICETSEIRTVHERQRYASEFRHNGALLAGYCGEGHERSSSKSKKQFPQRYPSPWISLFNHSLKRSRIHFGAFLSGRMKPMLHRAGSLEMGKSSLHRQQNFGELSVIAASPPPIPAPS